VRRAARALAVTATGAVAVLAVVAGPAAAQTSTTNPTSNFSFANGIVTSVHGASVQVSNTQTQSESTVALQDTTTYMKRVRADASVLVAGACVRVTGTGSDSKGITATGVQVSAADSTGSCAGPGARNDGQRPDFGNGRPRFNGNGNGNTNGNRPNRPTNFAIANGPIVSVSGDKITVKSTAFQRPATPSSSKGKSRSSSKTAKQQTARKTTTTNVVVTVGSSTTIEQTVTATAADVVTGKCVTATGTNGTGGVNAERVSISDPVNGACAGGFGRFGGGGPGGTGGTNGGATNA